MVQQIASFKFLWVIPTFLCAILAFGWWAADHEPMPTQSAPIELPPVSDDIRSFSRLLGYEIADAELVRYNTIFDLQAQGRFDEADQEILQLRDTTLLGAVKQQRYLHEDYSTEYVELRQWLEQYSDLPEASRVSGLAKRKHTDGDAAVPALANTAAPLKGLGLRDGVQGKQMPVRFKEGLNEWMAGRYAKAANIFADVSKDENLSPWHSSSAHFWAHRAYLKNGNNKQADSHLAAAAEYPFTLYGALALQRMGDASIHQQPLAELDRDILSLPAVKRAAYYAAMSDKESADRELRHLYPSLPSEQKRQLATVASKLGLPGLQLRMSQMLYRNQYASDAAAYPVPDWIPEYDMLIDPALVYAIVRQESGFDTKARNARSGATGAMQMMPSTARYVIKAYKLNEVKLASLDMSKVKPSNISVATLHDPVVNLTIGQHYIKYLADKPYIDGNLVYLLAAYNAGPAHLREWQERYGEIDDPLLFVELIPFRETRDYVQQVLSNYVVYNALIHKENGQALTLMKGEWLNMKPAEDRWASARERLFAQAATE